MDKIYASVEEAFVWLGPVMYGSNWLMDLMKLEYHLEFGTLTGTLEHSQAKAQQEKLII
jgi:hypothetical protein